MSKGSILMRKFPQQMRGQQRVERILEAAAEVFGETGFENATTNLIAERANTSIGSLYQFFPNKQSIIDTLCQCQIRETRGIEVKVEG
jgi:AcrR family transcriptional regulator